MLTQTSRTPHSSKRALYNEAIAQLEQTAASQPYFGPKGQIAQLMNTHLKYAANRDGRVLSAKTQYEIKTSLVLCFSQLRELGFRVEKVANLRLQHVKALVLHWEEQGVAAATMQSRLTALRRLSHAIGKFKMIPSASEMTATPASGQRHVSAIADKSWSGNDVDIASTVESARLVSPEWALQLELMHQFGLRMNEALQFLPRRDISLTRTTLDISFGTKGGRPRSIPVQTREQDDLVARLMDWQQVHPNLHYLGSADDSANSLAQNRKQFHRRMAQLGLTQHEQGVTAHGLRHEYVHARMQANGALAPIKLLKRGQFTGRMLELIGRPISFTDGSTMDDTDDSPERKAADPSQDLTARRNLVEQLGHSRTSITTMYSGSHSHLDQMRAATALGTCHILEGNATFIDEHANNAHVDVLWLAGDRAKGLFEFTDRTAPLVLIARIKEVIKNGVRQNPIISLQSFGREIGERFGMSVVVMLENDERVKAVGPGIELQLPTKPRTPAVRTTPNVAVPPGGFNVQDLMRPDEDEDH